MDKRLLELWDGWRAWCLTIRRPGRTDTERWIRYAKDKQQAESAASEACGSAGVILVSCEEVGK